ncbi:FecR domain-containing protein [Proteiniphilum sp. UBA5384]|uniref:FecR domain-containing protein n=1 Tax=Proteiniphilum sp. UBA5384 TaxID=1947279 RepID=UPI0025EFAD03|nr:FecR domain-containing protein [Proteiniphilum sp. UBA5384]
MEIPYEQIAAFLKGEISTSEKMKLEAWLEDNPRHRAIFYSLEKEWKFLKASPTNKLPDKEQVWAKIQKKIDFPTAATLYTKHTVLKITGIAASIALILGISLSFLINRTEHQSIQFTAFAPLGEKTQLTLPDSSRVWLNSGSTLTYYAHPHQRLISLQGEAFFDVKKNPHKLFIVQSGEISVQVHGTSFNVSAYESDKVISVSLEKGHVSLINQSNGVVLTDLRPNQMAEITKSDLKYRVVADDVETTKLWTKNILKVYNNDIYEVVKKLERWYGVNITLENVTSRPHYTFVVKTESMREFLDLMNRMTPITYKIEGKEVYIQLK